MSTVCGYVCRSGGAVKTVAAFAIAGAETAETAGQKNALVDTAVLSEIFFREFTARILDVEEMDRMDSVLRDINKAQTTMAYLRIIVMSVSIIGE